MALSHHQRVVHVVWLDVNVVLSGHACRAGHWHKSRGRGGDVVDRFILPKSRASSQSGTVTSPLAIWSLPVSAPAPLALCEPLVSAARMREWNMRTPYPRPLSSERGRGQRWDGVEEEQGVAVGAQAVLKQLPASVWAAGGSIIGSGGNGETRRVSGSVCVGALFIPRERTPSAMGSRSGSFLKFHTTDAQYYDDISAFVREIDAVGAIASSSTVTSGSSLPGTSRGGTRRCAHTLTWASTPAPPTMLMSEEEQDSEKVLGRLKFDFEEHGHGHRR
ncbi:hypothetical protein B0H19DRAFT_1063282 [Mycena capillaripes]|nr:hypothetical protein B0H19DRAFT_1063282 [Mycena capillaripes]